MGGLARLGAAGKARQVRVWLGRARQARQVWHGTARWGKVWHGRFGGVGRGAFRLGRRGLA